MVDFIEFEPGGRSGTGRLGSGALRPLQTRLRLRPDQPLTVAVAPLEEFVPPFQVEQRQRRRVNSPIAFGLNDLRRSGTGRRRFCIDIAAAGGRIDESDYRTRLAPLMAARGKGAIVNLSTMAADYGAPGMSLYGSSKAAINLLTKTWAAEYGPKGVRVNAVSPGPTRTEGTDAMGEGLEQLAAQAPAGRPATAEEIAEAIVFLATDRASFIHGAKLAVDGGRTAV